MNKPELQEERLQKYLANLGVGSRREIERWIEQGRVRVGHEIATLGMKVSPRSHIFVDGRPIFAKSEESIPRVLMYYKPEGQICTAEDPEGRETVFSSLPRLRQGRWVMIGRLDVSTMGLLLFTTHGELAHRLMHPSYEIEREYAVRVRGEVTTEILTRMKEGVMLEDGMAKFEDIKHVGGEGTNQWYHTTLREGRNREVRRLWESQQVDVTRLIRVRYGNVTLPRELSRGRWEHMTTEQIYRLGSLVQLNFREVR